MHCKKKRLFGLNLFTAVSHLFCIIKYSGVTLPALHSNILTVIRFARTLINVMGECSADEYSQVMQTNMKLI